MRITVTGCAGFIGFHLCKRLLAEGWKVEGVDNLSDYYDVSLKKARLNLLSGDFIFQHADINTCQINSPIVVNLAAQAGVRYSIQAPQPYIDSNVSGFQNVLNQCKDVEHIIYASSSSVYEMKSLYAVTKKTNEYQAKVHHELYGVPMTGIRFFTVYGPYGRPDMSFFKFTKAMLCGDTISLFNHGKHWRSFTHIDDIIEGLMRVIQGANIGNAVYDLGNPESVFLQDMLITLSRSVGIEPRTVMLPMQPGDSERTQADMLPFFDSYGEWGFTDLGSGVDLFVNWYKDYYK